jgi:hypothetical protein
MLLGRDIATSLGQANCMLGQTLLGHDEVRRHEAGVRSDTNMGFSKSAEKVRIRVTGQSIFP